jgi:hypothetical protein
VGLGLLVLLSVNSLGFSTEPSPVVGPIPTRLTSFEWRVITSPQYADVPFDVTILAKDENGASFPFNGNAFLYTTSGPYVYPAAVRFSNGVCDTSVVVTLAESLAMRCFTESAGGTSNVFEVLPGIPKRLVAILPGEHLAPGVPGGRAGLPDSQTAGDTFSFLVYVTDDWFNRIGLRDDSVYFGSDDRFARLPAGGRLSNGTGSFTGNLRTAGQRRIFTRPADGSPLRADTSTAFPVMPRGYGALLLLLPGEQPLPGDTATDPQQTPGKSGEPLPQRANIPFPVIVYACDDCWNSAAGPGDTVLLKSDFAFVSEPPFAALTDSVVFDGTFAFADSNQNLWAEDPQWPLRSYTSWLWVLGISEAQRGLPARPLRRPSLARNVLFFCDNGPVSLLGTSGRKVMVLRPGANDVSRLSQGVYFVRSEPSAVTKVVIQR